MEKYDTEPSVQAVEDACRQFRGDCDLCYLAEEGCPDYDPGEPEYDDWDPDDEEEGMND